MILPVSHIIDGALARIGKTEKSSEKTLSSYPFGAVAKQWVNTEQTQQETYRYGYQGQYAEEDTVTGWNSFELRMYDPVIGRFLAVDPMREFSSPYLGMGNNPNLTDPTGGCTSCFDNVRDLDMSGAIDDARFAMGHYSFRLPEFEVSLGLSHEKAEAMRGAGAARRSMNKFAKEGVPIIVGAPVIVIGAAEVGGVALIARSLEQIGRQSIINYFKEVGKNTFFEFSSQYVAQGGDLEKVAQEFDVFDVVSGTRFSSNIGGALTAGAIDFKNGELHVVGVHKDLGKAIVDGVTHATVGQYSNALPGYGEAILEISGGTFSEVTGNLLFGGN